MYNQKRKLGNNPAGLLTNHNNLTTPKITIKNTLFIKKYSFLIWICFPFPIITRSPMEIIVLIVTFINPILYCYFKILQFHINTYYIINGTKRSWGGGVNTPHGCGMSLLILTTT